MSGAGDPDGLGKFPARVVTILSLCMTVNTYSVVSLLSYVGVMVQHLMDLETTNKSGFYAGYLGSAYMLGRFAGGYALGRIADYVGRKPVMISGLLSIAAFSLTFGLSPSFAAAIASRLVLGLTNGITPALRTTLREVCGKHHVLRGMTYLSGSKAFCLVLGTGIGGLLAQPTVNYPNVFSSEGILARYPYLLPNLAGSIAALLLLPLVILYIPETKKFPKKDAERGVSSETTTTQGASKPSAKGPQRGNLEEEGGEKLAYEELADENGRGKLPQQNQPSPSSGAQETDSRNYVKTKPDCGHDDGEDDLVEKVKEPGVWGPDGLLAIRHVKMVLFLASAVQALNICFEEVFPLWALSTRDTGGLGWDTVEIGKVFLAAGLVVAGLLFFVFPRAIKVLGIAVYQRLGCFMGVVAFTATPNARVLGWNDSGVFLVSVGCTILVYCCQAMVTLALVIASTNMVQADMRGKLAGLYNAAESFGCFLGPVASATAFAWSISPGGYVWVDHRFVFLAAAGCLVIVTVLAWGTLTEENIMSSAVPKGTIGFPAQCGACASTPEADDASFTASRSGQEADLV